ncbi:MAG TPA: tRNA (guanosine(37)-N1)-methyltransferase TrmD [Clostridiales bacterium]|nr:tRNA (guanosine(37)-N1)-methyltransferase TrmD [Clostridiales bacterium]
MKVSVLTLFPEMIQAAVGTSITGRALSAGAFELETVDIRNFAVNSYGKVDDYCFGGGTGMLMMCQPVHDAHQLALQKSPGPNRRTIYLSPKGPVFNQKKAIELSGLDHLVLLCGHYEGVDQRVLDEIVDEELSIGDYVLTGGELAACVVIDAVARLIEGVLPNQEAYSKESHMSGVLEYPQYTRPAVWHDRPVPDVLLSGHHANIVKWQEMASLMETCRKRPDLFNQLKLDADAYAALASELAELASEIMDKTADKNID